ncbi:DUF4468 domain-containing protein [Pedobacter sp. MC2016-14]|uniref:DUF4468 domain-containing protein n=1 Tax=Pedobacter sp. MC2016-14 TaxID=2897327 RepID=UPI001E2F359A|nr:DUF4468 domain-containing protein [Pedobacter sp. MC2016-14]MCD0490351.1 DUF4468 domain-containing protein [Pedobacter sp. MC2016-14]
MRFLLLGLSFLSLFTLVGFAQDKPLPYDDRGKLIYYEVVSDKVFDAATLYANAKAFLKAKKMNSIGLDSGSLTASGKMVISKTAFKVGHPTGEVSYNFTFEVKDTKYRFWLTDFLFVPYERDRYANFVPSTAKGTPLEANPGKLNAAEWTSYQNATAKQAQSFATEFKAYLFAPLKSKAKPKEKTIISTKSW